MAWAESACVAAVYVVRGAAGWASPVVSVARTSRETRIALNYATRRCGWHGRRNYEFQPGVVAVYAGRVVTMARPKRRWAVSADGRGNGVLHEARAVFVAWYHGRPVGSLVAMWCGARLVTATLTDDDGCGERVCAVCPVRKAMFGQARR